MCPTYSIILGPDKYAHLCRRCEWMAVSKYERIGYNCKGLGWVLTRILKAFGVTEDRVNWVLSFFGRKCRCSQWLERLNTKVLPWQPNDS